MNTLRYKDLEIAFATSFNSVWNDKGSGGNRDGAYWSPNLNGELSGFSSVGDLGVGNYNDVNGTAVVAVVRAVQSDTQDPSKPALTPPVSYAQVWLDSGSGADQDGSFWRPVPRPGYVAMGLVCANGHSAPDLNAVQCVRTDLVVASLLGDSIWDDSGTGADDDFGSWQIVPPDAPGGEAYFSAGTFVGVSSHSKPANNSAAYSFRVQIEMDQQTPPPVPVLHGYSSPADFEATQLAYISKLPWFMVKDPNLTPVQQLQNCPVYELRRSDRYKLLAFGYNTSSADQELQYTLEQGVDAQSSSSFTNTTSIEIGAEWEVTPAFKATAKLNQSFSYTTTSASGWSQTVTKQLTATIPPSVALALYAIDSEYELYRNDGSTLGQTVQYSGASNAYWTQYPPATKANAAKVTTD